MINKDHFKYIKEALYVEKVAISTLTQEVKTPFYCYSQSAIEDNYHGFSSAFTKIKPLICYAVKANSNLAILKLLGKLGSGADCVSQGEIMRALKSGIPGKKIVFSGVGKTKEEIKFALQNKILQFNVESESELKSINEVATSINIKAIVAIRVNPNVDCGSHHKISTGKKEDKFGIDINKVLKVFKVAAKLENLELIGISTHIGSQILKLKPYKETFKQMRELVLLLRQNGFDIKRVDLGGGIGVPYQAKDKVFTAKAFADLVDKYFKSLDCELIFEPGRLIVANAGILVTQIIYIKNSDNKDFAIVDAGMNDLIRPSLYDAYHEIIPVNKTDNKFKRAYDVVGPVCESADIFRQSVLLPNLQEGDLIAIKSAGAYGAVMSSVYNTRLLIPEVMVKDKKHSIIKKRSLYNDSFRAEAVPNWL